MGTLKLLVPEETTNYVLNPSAETTGNFAAITTATATRSTTLAFYGRYSYRTATVADNDGISLTLSALPNAAAYVTMRIRGTPPKWEWSLDNSNWTVPTKIEDIDDNWGLYGASFVAAQANSSTTLYIRDTDAPTTFYLDGVQVEEADHWTTYIDGTQEGCEWLGPEHASTSSRSAQSRAGGEQKDLEDDFYFTVEDIIGAGVNPRTLNVDSYAILPGGELNSVKERQRSFTLVGHFTGTSRANLHSRRQDLIDELSGDKYAGNQPARLVYTGAAVHKYIDVYYESGFEINLTGDNPPCYEAGVALRLLAPDPNWYEIGESSATLDSNDSATLRYVAARLKSTGQWDDLGLTANPTTGGTIYSVCAASDGSVYFGGNFTEFDGSSGDDYCIRYDPEDETFNTLVGASDLNGIVYAISEAPDGTIYLGGAFTAVDGDADRDYVVAYNPSDDTWSDVGTPDTGAASITNVRAMAWDSSGNLYVGGNFTNFADDADADYLAQWDGSAWSDVGGGGGTGTVRTVAIKSDGDIYIGGEFTNWNAVAAADYMAYYDGSSWNGIVATTGAPGGTVNTIYIDKSDRVFIGGFFTNAGGNSDADYIFEWDGRQAIALQTGVSGAPWKIKVAPDGVVYVGGDFTRARGVSNTRGVAAWNGSSWYPLDANIAALSKPVYDFAFLSQDATVKSNYDVFIGFSGSDTDYFSGTATVTNDGTALAYPKIAIERSGGTSATIIQVRNEDTGKVLLFDYDLLDGETLTIDTKPQAQTITSSFFGGRPGAKLAGDDFGQFALLPGSNQITCFVDEGGSPTVTAYMLWRDVYKSMD